MTFGGYFVCFGSVGYGGRGEGRGGARGGDGEREGKRNFHCPGVLKVNVYDEWTSITPEFINDEVPNSELF